MGSGRASTFNKGLCPPPTHPWLHLHDLLRELEPPTAVRPDAQVANRSENQNAGGGDRTETQTDAKFKRESQRNSDKQGIQHKSIPVTGEKQSQMGWASLTSKAATGQHHEVPPKRPCPAGLCGRHASWLECPLSWPPPFLHTPHKPWHNALSLTESRASSWDFLIPPSAILLGVESTCKCIL